MKTRLLPSQPKSEAPEGFGPDMSPHTLQTRHTYACWCLTARSNLAFIAKQMEHKSVKMLVEVNAKWMDSESESESENEIATIWENLARGLQHP
jgi:integrase